MQSPEMSDQPVAVRSVWSSNARMASITAGRIRSFRNAPGAGGTPIYYTTYAENIMSTQYVPNAVSKEPASGHPTQTNAATYSGVITDVYNNIDF